MLRNGIPRICIYFGSTEGFGTELWEFASIFVPRNGIPSYLFRGRVLFRGMLRNGIPIICIYFGSTERNSELCSLPQKGSEQNSGSLLLFLFHGTEFRDVLFRGRVRNGIPRFSVPRNNRNSDGNNHLFRLFRLPRKYFFVGNSQPYLALNLEKWVFAVSDLDFLGHRISAAGVAPLWDNVYAISDLPSPTDCKALQRFLGMINFFHRFLPGVAMILQLLNAALAGNPISPHYSYWLPTMFTAFIAAKPALVAQYLWPTRSPERSSPWPQMVGQHLRSLGFYRVHIQTEVVKGVDTFNK
jgi:hypothetical protein